MHRWGGDGSDSSPIGPIGYGGFNHMRMWDAFNYLPSMHMWDDRPCQASYVPLLGLGEPEPPPKKVRTKGCLPLSAQYAYVGCRIPPFLELINSHT
jgi:hypothetical protein